MKRSQITHPVNTAEYVAQHARFRASRGRAPSAQYLGFRNPRIALRIATHKSEVTRSIAVMSDGLHRFSDVVIQLGEVFSQTTDSIRLQTTDSIRLLGEAYDTGGCEFESRKNQHM